MKYLRKWKLVNIYVLLTSFNELYKYNKSELTTYQLFQSKYIISHKYVSSLQTISETFLHLNEGQFGSKNLCLSRTPSILKIIEVSTSIISYLYKVFLWNSFRCMFFQGKDAWEKRWLCKKYEKD